MVTPTVGTIAASDGSTLAYLTYGSRENPAIILIHGWSGSSAAFARNIGGLAANHFVVTPDLRGHGGSPGTRHGARVSRLAKDLDDLLAALYLDNVTVVGCSIGSAVLWAYIELFSCVRLRAAVFVDQAPLQQYAADGSWTLGSNGLYSSEALANFCALLQADSDSFLRGVPLDCLVSPTEDDKKFFHAEAIRADPWFLARLMEDHNRNDWRETLALVKCPALVIAGQCTKIFPLEGIKYVAENIPGCQLKVVENSGHWMYYEKPDEFNETILKFLAAK